MAPLIDPVFISDLHLAPDRPRTILRFARFLREDAARYRELVILGDLFEFWIGDDAAAPVAPVLASLAQIAARGRRLLVMHGNRDPLLGVSFERVTRCQLIADPVVVEVAGTPTLLAHGDAWCTQDTAYQQFRTMVRDPGWQRSVLTRPVEERLAMARAARAESEAAEGGKAMGIMDGTPTAVEAALHEAGVHRLIHGHTHRPAAHELMVGGTRCERWVLPDWDYDSPGDPRGGYLDFVEGQPRLVLFED
ncbi:MAG: UDP-2,3-diacylglucosamine diphosphatase [Betaproteobacteria bacterium]